MAFITQDCTLRNLENTAQVLAGCGNVLRLDIGLCLAIFTPVHTKSTTFLKPLAQKTETSPKWQPVV